jgi:hypothetical protein
MIKADSPDGPIFVADPEDLIKLAQSLKENGVVVFQSHNEKVFFITPETYAIQYGQGPKDD